MALFDWLIQHQRILRTGYASWQRKILADDNPIGTGQSCNATGWTSSALRNPMTSFALTPPKPAANPV